VGLQEVTVNCAARSRGAARLSGDNVSPAGCTVSGALLLLAVLVPPTLWIALAIIVAMLVIIAVRERLAGRYF
jgi:uncharacterized protein (DUF983 family)